MEAVIAPSKLQEHRRLVEEAMEVYKEVEKSSKMKSFSNQSIMLAALEDDQDELHPETLDAIEFLEDCVNQLEEQIGQLDEEYEKLSEKKARKNTHHIIEERKQEIESLTQRDDFHIQKIGEVIEFLRCNKLDPEFVWMIQDDLNFYIESNQEPDFIDDETLYDELFKEAEKNKDRDPKEQKEPEDELLPANGNIAANTSVSSVSNVPKSNNVQPNPILQSKAVSSTPQRLAVSIPTTPDLSSPAIIKTLKPATTPSKPVGKLKWAAAAAGAGSVNISVSATASVSPSVVASPGMTSSVSETSESSTDAGRQSNGKSGDIIDTTNSKEDFKKTQDDEYLAPRNISKDDPNYKLIEVLKNSKLTTIELDLFSDLNLILVPPGIQDFIFSSASARSQSTGSKLLVSPSEALKLNIPIYKPYLPNLVQVNNISREEQFIPTLKLSKVQPYWNKIRANNQFEQCVQEIKILAMQNNQKNIPLINELTFVLFFGLYFGFTPLENLIAESCLFSLGWKPYAAKSSEINNVQIQNPNQANLTTQSSNKNYLFWFKCIKKLPNPPNLTFEANVEFGDYYVFDLATWDIYIKHSFRFDHHLSQSEPSKSIF